MVAFFVIQIHYVYVAILLAAESSMGGVWIGVVINPDSGIWITKVMPKGITALKI